MIIEGTRMIVAESQTSGIWGTVPDWIQAGAVAFAATTYWLQRKTHNLQALLFVLQELGSEDIREARAQVLKFPPGNYWNDEQRKTARRVCVALDRVAFLYKNKALPDEVFFWFMPQVFEDQWAKLKPFILDVRKNNQDNDEDRPRYCRSLQWLVEHKMDSIKAKASLERWDRMSSYGSWEDLW